MNIKLYDYPARDEVYDEVIVIYKGLSVTVCGHLIDLYRDNAHKIATVRASVITGHNVTGLEYGDVKRAVDLLARRAERFLGHGWKVVKWSPPTELSQNAG